MNLLGIFGNLFSAEAILSRLIGKIKHKIYLVIAP
jgi:hypothetical protein